MIVSYFFDDIFSSGHVDSRIWGVIVHIIIVPPSGTGSGGIFIIYTQCLSAFLLKFFVAEKKNQTEGNVTNFTPSPEGVLQDLWAHVRNWCLEYLD